MQQKNCDLVDQIAPNIFQMAIMVFFLASTTPLVFKNITS